MSIPQFTTELNLTDRKVSKRSVFVARIRHLRLAFCKVWKVRLVINIMLIILKSLFDIGSCSTRLFSRINTLLSLKEFFSEPGHSAF